MEVRILDEEEGTRQDLAHPFESRAGIERDDVVHLPAQRQRGIEPDDDRAVRAHDVAFGQAEGVDELERTRQGTAGRDDEVVTRLGEVEEHPSHRFRQGAVVVDDRAVDVERDEVCGQWFSLTGRGCAAQNRGPSGPCAVIPPR